MHQQLHHVPHKTQSLSPDVPKQPPDSNRGDGMREEATVSVCARLCVTRGARVGARGLQLINVTKTLYQWPSRLPRRPPADPSSARTGLPKERGVWDQSQICHFGAM